MAVDLSVQHLASRDESRHIEEAIELALKSPLGNKYVWVIVEAEEDCSFYKQFFENNAKVYSASAQNNIGGYTVVEKFVREIPKTWPNVKILGIRDADYTKFQTVPYIPQPNIFLTHYRDLEMMLLSFDSVKQGLTTWNAKFPLKISETEPFARILGYLRIYNQEKKLSCSFADAKVSLKSEWDNQTHAMKASWQSSLYKKFEKGVKKECESYLFKEQDLEAFIVSKKLQFESMYDICRGHDFLSLLSLMMIQSQIYNKNTITSKMIESSSLSNFKKTTLHADLKKWEQNENVVILKN